MSKKLPRLSSRGYLGQSLGPLAHISKILPAVKNGYNDITLYMISLISRTRAQVQPTPNSTFLYEACGLILHLAADSLFQIILYILQVKLSIHKLSLGVMPYRLSIGGDIEAADIGVCTHRGGESELERARSGNIITVI